jgi:membrane-associated phospholipid phosphatase
MLDKLLELDLQHSRRLNIAGQPGRLRSIAAILAHSGDSWFWLAGLVFVYILGDAAWKFRAAVLAASILVTAVLVLALKFSVRRRRPDGQWGAIYRSTDPHSFPSGHAARAFLITTLAIGMGPAWFGIVALLWAPLVTLARVAMGVHYLSDVLAGVLVGLLMGLVILRIIPSL